MHAFSKVPILVIVGAIALTGASSANAQAHYKLVKSIDLPGKGGHGDWLAFDAPTDTVWIAQSPAHNVVVLDADNLSVKAVIGGVEDPNGVALGEKYAFVGDATANKLVVIDKKTFKQVASVDSGGKKSDGVAVDTHNGDVYVGNDDSNTDTVFKGQPPFKRVAEIKLKPEAAKDGPDVNLYVPELDRIYQPVDNMVDVIDPSQNKVVAVWDFKLKKSAKPMVYDSKSKHLVVGSRDQKMLIVDPASGKLVASIPFEGGNIDQTAIDVGARRIFVGDKSGNLEVIDLDTNQVIDHLKTEKNVHTLTVDPKTHRVFVYLGDSNKIDVFEPI